MVKQLLCFSFLFFHFSFMLAQERDTTMWVTNGAVHAISRNENIIYLGGSFSYVGPSTGSGVLLDEVDGKLIKKNNQM
jgi:hypothetical protein